ncbi:Uncharacterised protein [Yersinia enterocolitica]|nr:Uncharacterised protein [Yersinia enterocolitica]
MVAGHQDHFLLQAQDKVALQSPGVMGHMHLHHSLPDLVAAFLLLSDRVGWEFLVMGQLEGVQHSGHYLVVLEGQDHLLVSL